MKTSFLKFLVLTLAVISACIACTNQVENCTNDFNVLIDNSFSEPYDGIVATNSFINKYSEYRDKEEINSILNKAEKILGQFEYMNKVYSNETMEFNSFIAEYNKLSNSSFSDYYVVNRTWADCKEALLEKRIDMALTDYANRADSYLATDAIRICNEKLNRGPFRSYEYSGNDYNIISISTPLRDGRAVFCKADYEIPMVGTFLGRHKGTIKITISGKFEYIENVGIKYSHDSYNIYAATGDIIL